MSPWLFFVLLGCAAALTALSVREHKRSRQSRMVLLDAAVPAVESAIVSHGGDGFPRLDGRFKGFEVRAELIPDTMVVRRLPQLWLSVTLLAPMPHVQPFGVLVRYAGNEFYALTPDFEHPLEPPAGLPREVLIRARQPEAQGTLDRLRLPIAKLLADPKIKEVAITAKGLRIVRQAAEGRRGEHLLLRQAVFDTPGVSAAELRDILENLEALRSLLKLPFDIRAA